MASANIVSDRPKKYHVPKDTMGSSNLVAEGMPIRTHIESYRERLARPERYQLLIRSTWKRTRYEATTMIFCSCLSRATQEALSNVMGNFAFR